MIMSDKTIGAGATWNLLPNDDLRGRIVVADSLGIKVGIVRHISPFGMDSPAVPS